MTPEEEIASLQKELALLQAKHDAINPPEFGKDEITVLSAIAKSDSGLQHHEIETKTKFSSEKVRLHLERLGPKGFVLATGGDKKPLRWELDFAGRVFLDSKKLL